MLKYKFHQNHPCFVQHGKQVEAQQPQNCVLSLLLCRLCHSDGLRGPFQFQSYVCDLLWSKNTILSSSKRCAVTTGLRRGDWQIIAWKDFKVNSFLEAGKFYLSGKAGCQCALHYSQVIHKCEETFLASHNSNIVSSNSLLHSYSSWSVNHNTVRKQTKEIRVWIRLQIWVINPRKMPVGNLSARL